jgi:hypothetical protein
MFWSTASEFLRREDGEGQNIFLLAVAQRAYAFQAQTLHIPDHKGMIRPYSAGRYREDAQCLLVTAVGFCISLPLGICIIWLAKRRGRSALLVGAWLVFTYVVFGALLWSARVSIRNSKRKTE